MNPISVTMSHSIKSEYPWEGCSIYDVFTKTAESNKDKTFLYTSEESITFGDLLEKVKIVSHSILSLKLDPDRPIVVCLPASTNWAIVVLAILKSGHFYIPVDPDFPEERNRKILTNSKASVLIGTTEPREFTVPFISVASLLNPAQKPSSDENVVVRSESKSCIIYTSGSTGTPKGVIQTHQSILHGAWRRSLLQNISSNDRMTWLYSPSVKGTEYCFYVALLNGASLHVRKIMDHFDDKFIDWMALNKITVYHSVASYFRYVAGSLESSDISLEHLRLVILGGERVLKSDLDLFFSNFKNTCRLFTGLGATESGTICHLPFEELSKVQQAVAPIGYPVKDVTLEVLDEKGAPLKTGIGVLSVRSKYISPGYWNENSDRFKMNSETGEISYVSGDLAEIDSYGVIHHRGRADASVKINGYLVNLLEVESAIMKYAGIQEAIIIAHEVDFQNRLYAFIQAKEKFFDINQLKSYLNSNLVKQMVPLHYTLVENWPRLDNGKINRKELINLVKQTKEEGTSNTYTELEEKILAIWKKVLSANEIPKDKTFNEAGGDSVAALRLALEFKKAGFTFVNLVDLIPYDTIEKQANMVVQKQK